MTPYKQLAGTLAGWIAMLVLFHLHTSDLIDFIRSEPPLRTLLGTVFIAANLAFLLGTLVAMWRVYRS